MLENYLNPLVTERESIYKPEDYWMKGFLFFFALRVFFFLVLNLYFWSLQISMTIQKSQKRH